ncbi:MAG: hypothetical protein ACRC4M_01995 [Mycoplasma sp.]
MADNKNKKKTTTKANTNKKVDTKDTKSKTTNKAQSTKKDEKKELSFGSKFIIFFLTIITLGLFKIYLNKKIKKAELEKESKSETKTPKLKTSNKIPFKVEKFIELLGGVENILTSVGSLNTLKLEVVDKNLVKQEEIKKIGAKGIMISKNKISIIFGDFAIILNDEINKLLK